jgi:transposase InsO family protein
MSTIGRNLPLQWGRFKRPYWCDLSSDTSLRSAALPGGGQSSQIHAHSRQTYGSPWVRAALRAARRSGGGGWRSSCGGPGGAACMACAGGCARRSPTRAPPRPRTGWHARSRRPQSARPTGSGWPLSRTSQPARARCYLAIILDGFSHRVVGWAMADHLQTDRVRAALRLALQRRRPTAGLIHHRDRWCQYTSLAFGQHLRTGGLVPSTGSVGDGHDNAVAASFCASRKVELVDRQDWPTWAAARVGQSWRTARFGTIDSACILRWDICAPRSSKPVLRQASPPDADWSDKPKQAHGDTATAVVPVRRSRRRR